MARRLVPKGVRAAPLADAEVDRCRDVADAVDERILGRLGLSQRLDVGAQAVDVAAAIGAQLPLQSPSAKREQPGLDAIEHLRRVEAVLQIALEYVGPQIVALDRQALQLEPAARTEVVVGHEVARQLPR